jgi:flagellar biosynthesis/type III secretory pathway M-ring protein FliF/YscJ
MPAIFDEISKVWGDLTSNQKILLLAAGLFILISFVVLIFFAAREEYVPLYTQIHMNKAPWIIGKLEEWKQPYKLERARIMVPIQDRRRIQEELEALPKKRTIRILIDLNSLLPERFVIRRNDEDDCPYLN